MNNWICNEREEAVNKINLFIFPASGGTASTFRKWHNLIDKNINIYPVQYPMREKRVREEMPDNLIQLSHEFCDSCIDLIKREDDVKNIFFGHCAGALIGYEAALYLEDKYDVPIAALMAISIPSPNKFNPNKFEGKPISRLDYDQFIRFIKRFNPLDETLYSNRFIMEYYRKLTVADFKIAEEYGYDKDRPIKGDVVSFVGREDDYTPIEDAQLWRNFTMGKFEFITLNGGHRACETNREEICKYINNYSLV